MNIYQKILLRCVYILYGGTISCFTINKSKYNINKGKLKI